MGKDPFPLHFSRVAPATGSSADTDSQFPTDGCSNCSRCFTRDTIANAAAKVGPAVVNLSVPKGKFIVSVCSIRSYLSMY